jgi:Leucine-rich repeat (LRR) protein
VTNFPAEIKNLNHLGRLILSENQLTNFPTEICKIPNLFFLHLDNNRLTNLPPEIGNLTSLNELDLSNNQFTKLPSEIKKLTNLSTCEISYNELLDDMSKEIVYKLLQEDKSLFRTLSRNPMRYILKYKIELILLIGIFGSIIGIFCFSLKKYRFYEWLCWGIMIVNWILFMIRYLTYGRGL